jgi:CubicO group peptidase (beta-lactamase class C family)
MAPITRRAFVLVPGGLLLAGSSEAAKPPRPPFDLPGLLEATKTPGLAAQGMVGGKPFRHVGGVREAGKPDPITAETLFSAASLTKPVFAMEVRRLVREGRLEWRKPLQAYVPLGLTGDAAAITAEHVLTHATGLRNWRFDPREALAAAFPPGSRWQYSGEGYVLLQRVVEHLVGKPLGLHLNETVLPRLGMTRSTFTWSPEVEKAAVSGHGAGGGLLEKSAVFYEKAAHAVATKAGTTTDRMRYDDMIEAARKFDGLPLPVTVVPNTAGSLWTTVSDYATFLQRSIEDHARHPEEYAARNRVNRHISWTLSWGVDSSLGAPGFFHWGDGSGVKNFAWWQPAAKTAVVIFTNGDHGASAYRVLLRRLIGADPIAPEWV